MKILLTTDTYFPMINGVVISTNNLYKELKRNGHDVRIMTLSHTEKEEFLDDVYYLKSMKVNIYPDARIKAPFYNELVKEIINWQPDIVHSQTEFSTMLTAKYIVKRLNIPHIHTYHTMYEDYTNYIFRGKIIKKNMVAKMTKMLLNSLEAVIAPTSKTEKALINYEVNSDIYVIPTGIDLNRFQRSITEEEKSEILSSLGMDREEKIIVYIGRIAEEKNIHEIIKLFPTLREKIKDIKLLIVGGGPKLQELKEQVKEMNLDKHIIFTGMVKPEEVYKYYKIADVFVTASTSETQGLTYLEALSSGCPVVCKWDQCVEGVVIQGQNGFSYNSDWEFGRYISEILSSEELATRMRKEAEIKAKQYSSMVFGDRVLNVYEKTVNYSNNAVNCPAIIHTKNEVSSVHY